MNLLFALSITTGILSGLLVWFTGLFGIASWIAFLGATSYFASPKKGIKGLTEVWLTNFSGAIWAILIMISSTYLNTDIAAYACTALFAFCMCIQAKVDLFKFIPGTFLGAAAIFSADGEWLSTFVGLFIGAIFGFLMNYTGEYLHQFNANRVAKKQTISSSNMNQ